MAELKKELSLYGLVMIAIGASVGVGIFLTPGKIANIVITDGSPLLQVTQIKGVFIDGNPYQPETRQTRLYEKYQKRLLKK